ncbi:MAG: zinc ABC transporter substrate-binding protein [Ignavibacteriales bacterium]|nr:zinc ABC transporter substrate-binding protein [Ignavibacteriales bacterium]
MSKLSKLNLILFLVILFLGTSCKEKYKFTSEQIKISVSLPPFADFVKQITGNRADVFTLIPPGTNAHSFEPTPENLKNIIDSDIYFGVGEILNLEKLILEKIGTPEFDLIDCSSGIDIINNNPHYWLSPKNVRIITQNILDVLSQKYPQHKNYFTNNRNNFVHKVDSVSNVIYQIIYKKSENVLFVYHPAWKYFAEQYNLEEISIEQDGKSPKANDLKNFIEAAKLKGAKCIFFDPHFDDSSVLAIAETLDLAIDSLNPLPTDYIKNMEDIALKLDKHLK